MTAPVSHTYYIYSYQHRAPSLAAGAAMAAAASAEIAFEEASEVPELEEGSLLLERQVLDTESIAGHSERSDPQHSHDLLRSRTVPLELERGQVRRTPSSRIVKSLCQFRSKSACQMSGFRELGGGRLRMNSRSRVISVHSTLEDVAAEPSAERRRRRALTRIQAAIRGRLVRVRGGLLNPHAMRNTVQRLRCEQSGFRVLGRLILVFICLLSTILLQRDVPAAAATEAMLRYVVDSVDAPPPHSVDDAMEWCRRAYEGWYAYDGGLNADDRQAQRRKFGVTSDYTPTIAELAPLTLGACTRADAARPTESGPSEELAPERWRQLETEPEPEQQVDAATKFDGSQPQDPVADPEPQLGGTTEAFQQKLLPDSCRRVALYEEERKRRAACRSSSTAAVDVQPRGLLRGTPNQFLGAMLIVQTRRLAVPCSTAVDEERLCYSDWTSGQDPLPPYDQFWHYYHPPANGYLLPLDLGHWGIPKDSGRCALELARLHNWTGHTTRSISANFVTYNPLIRRLGTATVRFDVDHAGGVTMHTEIASSTTADSPYRRLPYAALPYVEALSLLLVVVLDVRPLYHKTRAIGFIRALFVSPRLDICLGWVHLAIVCFLFGGQTWRVIDSIVEFDGIVAPPQRDIRDNPHDFSRVLRSADWVALDALRARRHSYLLLAILGVGASRLLLATRFHPRMSVLIDTLTAAFATLQSLLVLYCCCLILFAVGGHALFGSSLRSFATFGAALYSVFVASVGELEKISEELASVDPFLGVLFFSLLVVTNVFILLNILLSVVMETYKAVAEKARQSSGAGRDSDAPSFLLAMVYALLSSRKQLVVAANALEAMPPTPTLRTEIKVRLKAAGVGPTTMYALLHAAEKMGDGHSGSLAPAARATVLETARQMTRTGTRLLHLQSSISKPRRVRRATHDGVCPLSSSTSGLSL